jgi:hypothetical protein
MEQSGRGLFKALSRKTTKNFSRDIRSPGQDLTQGPLENESGC